MNNQEIAQAERRRRGYWCNWISALLGRAKHENVHDTQWPLLDVYEVSVINCFIPLDFNEELPLYILDTGKAVMILFGQWLYDPSVMNCSKVIFDNWDCERAFFADFDIRCSAKSGEAFQFSVQKSTFIEARRLSDRLQFKSLRECQVIPRGSETLLVDLEKTGLIRSE